MIEYISGNPCPFNKPVQKINDMETLNFVYYKTKTAQCMPQTNTTETAYSKTVYPSMALPSFMTDEKEVVVFSCIDGYVPGKQDGLDVCINAAGYCPIDEVLMKATSTAATAVSAAAAGAASKTATAANSAAVLKDTKTDMICIKPANTSMVLVAMSSTSVMLNCAAGYYSAPIQLAGEAHRQCVKCPDGKTSLKGSVSPDDCRAPCTDGNVANPDNKSECVPCNGNSTYNQTMKACVCNPGYYGHGAGANGCSSCPIGSYCTGGRFVEKCDPASGLYSDGAMATECKFCPPNSTPDIEDGAGISCTCQGNVREFDAASGLCKEKQ
jgi:hypothetical protein